MTPLNPWLIVGALVALAASFCAGGYLGYDYAGARCKAAEADRRELVAEIRTANLHLADGIASRTETALGSIRIENTTINREVRHEREIYTRVLDNPDCAIPPSTVGVLNRARGYGGGSGAGEPAREVPAAATPEGRAAPPR